MKTKAWKEKEQTPEDAPITGCVRHMYSCMAGRGGHLRIHLYPRLYFLGSGCLKWSEILMFAVISTFKTGVEPVSVVFFFEVAYAEGQRENHVSVNSYTNHLEDHLQDWAKGKQCWALTKIKAKANYYTLTGGTVCS